MKKIEQIINKYDSYNNGQYRKQIEELINNSINEIKESFIEFYGESKRVEIEEKFSRMRIIVPPLDPHSSYKQMKKEIEKYIADKHSIEFYYDYSIDDDDFIETLDAPAEVQEELIEVRKKIKPYMDLSEKYVELEEKMEEKLEQEEYPKFIEIARRMLKKENKYTDEVLNNIDINSMDTIITAFNTIYQIYEDENSKYIYGSRITDILNFFKIMGIEQSELQNLIDKEIVSIDEFKNIMLNSENSKLIPSIDTIRNILSEFNTTKSTITRGAEIKTLQTFTPEEQELINFKGFIGTDPAIYGYLGAFEPFIVENNSEQELGCVIYINYYNESQETLGSILIHEINHYLETSFKYTTQGTYLFRSGFDYMEKNENHQLMPRQYNSYRHYELLNEVINEFITLDILRNIRVKPNNSIYKEDSGTIYNNAFFLLEEFYQNYKDIIIESRQTGNIDIIYNAVGKENFEELARLLSEFYELIINSGFKYQDIIEEVNKGKIGYPIDNFLDTCSKKDEIIASMHSYNPNANRSKGSINIYIIILILSIIITIISILYIIYKTK